MLRHSSQIVETSLSNLETEPVRLSVEQNSMLLHVNATAMTSRQPHHSSQIVEALPANLETEPVLFELERDKTLSYVYTKAVTSAYNCTSDTNQEHIHVMSTCQTLVQACERPTCCTAAGAAGE